MTKPLNLFFALTLAFTLSACGGGDDGGGGAGDAPTDTSSNYLGGACGSKVISDFNNIPLRCKYADEVKELRECKNTAQSFLNKYPNISCEAEQLDSNSVDNRSITIKASDIQSLIDSLTKEGI
jgi:hypothetical protein